MKFFQEDHNNNNDDDDDDNNNNNLYGGNFRHIEWFSQTIPLFSIYCVFYKRFLRNLQILEYWVALHCVVHFTTGPLICVYNLEDAGSVELSSSHGKIVIEKH